MGNTTMASVRLKLMLMLTPLDKFMLDSQLSMLMLLDIPTMLESLLPLLLPLLLSLPMLLSLPPTPPPPMLLLPTPLMVAMDTTMASVRLKLTLRHTPSVRSMLDFTTPMPTDLLLPSTPLPTLLDVLVMLVLAIPLVLATPPVLATMVSTTVNYLANDQVWLINSPFTNK